MSARRSTNGHGKTRATLITGGAGFIGCNIAHRLLSMGRRVLVYDNLSRAGVEHNLRWLQAQHPTLLDFEHADVRDEKALRNAVKHADAVYHFAAQVAVTSSLIDPIADFEINVRGTLNLLEAVRALPEAIPMIFTSTNKVYGALPDIGLHRDGQRYMPISPELRGHGVGEDRPLDFHSPYGCSKGAADQYVIDYARSYGLPALVFRMSCIYGPHQFGNEDQGWVAHFLIRALEGRGITLYGDGMQVRDILYIDDLANAFLMAEANVRRLAGQAFNIGGGVANTVSLLEVIQMIGALHGAPPETRFDDWRTGDQQYYVSDTRKFKSMTGWQPRTSVRDGLGKLYAWLREARTTPQPALNTPAALVPKQVH